MSITRSRRVTVNVYHIGASAAGHQDTRGGVLTQICAVCANASSMVHQAEVLRTPLSTITQMRVSVAEPETN